MQGTRIKMVLWCGVSMIVALGGGDDIVGHESQMYYKVWIRCLHLKKRRVNGQNILYSFSYLTINVFCLSDQLEVILNPIVCKHWLPSHVRPSMSSCMVTEEFLELVWFLVPKSHKCGFGFILKSPDFVAIDCLCIWGLDFLWNGIRCMKIVLWWW